MFHTYKWMIFWGKSDFTVNLTLQSIRVPRSAIIQKVSGSDVSRLNSNQTHLENRCHELPRVALSKTNSKATIFLSLYLCFVPTFVHFLNKIFLAWCKIEQLHDVERATFFEATTILWRIWRCEGSSAQLTFPHSRGKKSLTLKETNPKGG